MKAFSRFGEHGISIKSCDCEQCRGTGRVECDECDGSGTQERFIGRDDAVYGEIEELLKDAELVKQQTDRLIALKPEMEARYREQMKRTHRELEERADEIYTAALTRQKKPNPAAVLIERL